MSRKSSIPFVLSGRRLLTGGRGRICRKVFPYAVYQLQGVIEKLCVELDMHLFELSF
jgi:hypothetical protein